MKAARSDDDKIKVVVNLKTTAVDVKIAVRPITCRQSKGRRDKTRRVMDRIKRHMTSTDTVM